MHSYSTITKMFHWLTALLILTVIPLGAVANRLPLSQIDLKFQLFSFHKTLGVIIFSVALLRILWALTQTKPGPLHPDRKGEITLAEIIHWLLYISLVAVPLTGWIHHAALDGFAPILLPIGQGLPFVPKSESIAETFGSLHWIWSKIMIGAILLHIAGALKHAFIDKDLTIARMWFGNNDMPQTIAHKTHLIAPIGAIAIYLLVTGAGAMAGMFSHEKGESLAAVTSQWTVQDGSINLQIQQSGNPVDGSFDDWTAAINFDPEGAGTLGNVTTQIAINSLTLGSVTGQAMGADFFDAETFPTATFTGDITQKGESYIADGTLKIKDNEIPTQLPFTLNIQENQAIMAGTLTLNRQDFNIGDSIGSEDTLGYNVTVNINLTATR